MMIMYTHLVHETADTAVVERQEPEDVELRRQTVYLPRAGLVGSRARKEADEKT